MLVFGTEMHLVTGLLVILEVFLLGGQLISWLYYPKDRRGLLFSWLLVLMIIYNVFGGFFPDKEIRWISYKFQTMLAWGSGFAVAAFIPYYFYKAFELKRLKLFAFKGMLFFLALPYLIFFVADYHVQEDIGFSIKWGLIAPAIYGLAFLWFAYRAIAERYRQNLEAERLEMILTYLAILPWICMVPFGYFGVTQLTEVLTTNTGLLIISCVLIARSVREKQQEQEAWQRWKSNGSPVSNKVTFERNLLKFNFSTREIEVIRLLREGYTKQEVGEKLFIATTTVSRHTQNIYYKADVNNRIELMRRLETEE